MARVRARAGPVSSSRADISRKLRSKGHFFPMELLINWNSPLNKITSGLIPSNGNRFALAGLSDAPNLRPEGKMS